MEALELLKLRRSIREYKKKSIPKEVLVEIVDAARFAPTARNLQPWQFIVVTEQSVLKKIGQTTDHGRFICEAAACIAVFCEDTKYYLEDGCCATQNILLAAADLGVGSCWVAGDKKPYCSQISNLLDAGPSLKLVSLIALGYPETNKACAIADKKILKDLIHWDKF